MTVAARPTPQKRAYKVKDVAIALDISSSKAYELIATREIPSFKVGTAIRVNVDDLDAWILARTRKCDKE